MPASIAIVNALGKSEMILSVVNSGSAKEGRALLIW